MSALAIDEREDLLEHQRHTAGSANRPVVVYAAASLSIAMLMSVSMNLPVWVKSGFDPAGFWSGVASFLLPVLLSLGVLEAANRLFLSGESRRMARRAVWTGFALRAACAVLIPLALRFWGDPTIQQRSGFLFTDAYNASVLAWTRTDSDTTLVDGWESGKGDNTGGLVALGMATYRLFSPAMPRPLLMNWTAAVFAAMTAAAAYRLGELYFSPKHGNLAAWIVALYPEAVLIGSVPLQQAYLAALFGWLLYCISALGKPPAVAADEIALPRRGILIAGIVLAGAGTYFISFQFFLLTIIFLALASLWLVNARSTGGKTYLVLLGIMVAGLILLSFLSELDAIPAAWDLLKSQTDYLFGAAWTEFDKMLEEGSPDMLTSILLLLPRSVAFWVAGFYGIFQPILPAAIGFRRAGGVTSPLWQAIGILRATGWYLMLPLLVYATVAAMREWRMRLPPLMLAVLFWINSFASSYRSLGDQWDNPRYRLFLLIPMAILAAWAWLRWREARDPWLPRITVPFLAGVVLLTGWYVLRYWFGLVIPPVAAFLLIMAAAGAAFLVTIYWKRPSPAPPAG